MATDLPWGRSLEWPEVQQTEREVTLAAGPDHRAIIARDLGLEGLAALRGDLTLRPWLDGVAIEGCVVAEMTRMCGVSLESFVVAIDEPIKVRIVPMGSPNAPSTDAAEVIVDLESEDPPDEATSGVIDLAAYVVEALALALDPFPRQPGAVFSPPEDTGPISPFAVLSTLSRRPS